MEEMIMIGEADYDIGVDEHLADRDDHGRDDHAR